METLHLEKSVKNVVREETLFAGNRAPVKPREKLINAFNPEK